VIPVKGKEGLDVIFTPPRQVDITRMGKKIGTTKLYNIGVSILKSQLYGYLKQEINKETGEIPEGYCFFPKRVVDNVRAAPNKVEALNIMKMEITSLLSLYADEKKWTIKTSE
jgi:phage terminase large subunit GpA-like protein